MLISVVLPVYNEEECIQASYNRLSSALELLQQQGYTLEFVFVNDGSKDKSEEILRQIQINDSRVKLLNFARNFGHQIAITAGVDYAQGDAVAVIDADMQDPPEVIVQMVAKWREGYQVVYGKRAKRAGESWFKKVTAKLYYRLLNSLTSIELPVDTGDFRLIDKKVAEYMRNIREHNRYVRGLVVWVGFKHCALEYEREARLAGETKYPFKKMLKLALDGILSFSYAPLRLILNTGVIFIILSVLGGFSLFFWYKHLVIYLTISLFFTGIILSALGIIAEYISRITDDTRNRPLYTLRD